MFTSFKSAISSFSVIVFVFMLLQGVFLVRVGNYIGAAIVGFLILFFIYLYLSTEYIITNDNGLLIKCGFLINERIDIKAINKINKTRTILAAPAFSFERIQIYFGLYQSVVISPVNKDNFIKQLLLINPEIEIEI